MCGEVPDNCFKVEITIYFNQNDTKTCVPLPRQLENVKEVWLMEYLVVLPTGPRVWRLDLGTTLAEYNSSNLTGKGYPLFIDNAVITHVVFESPRIMSNSFRKLINVLDCTITGNTNQAPVAPAILPAITFSEAAFKLVFVCYKADWQPDLAVANMVNEPRRAAFPFSTKTGNL